MELIETGDCKDFKDSVLSWEMHSVSVQLEEHNPKIYILFFNP